MSDHRDETPDDERDPRIERAAAEPDDATIEERLRQARLSGALAIDALDDDGDEEEAGDADADAGEAGGPGPDAPAPEAPASGPDAEATDAEATDAEATDAGAAGEDASGNGTEAPAAAAGGGRPGRLHVALDPGDDHVEDDLGAAATLPGARSRDGRGTASTDRPAPARTGPRRRLRRAGVVAAALAVLVLAAIPLAAGAFESTPGNRYGLSYGGGPFEGEHFQEVVEPGSGLFLNGIGDSLYLYPADQRSYIVTGRAAEDEDGAADDSGAATDTDAITAPTRDRVEVGYQVAVYFTLNVDRLQQFHEQLGLRYRAYEGGGWDRMIQDTFRPQLEAALQEQTRRHDVADLFGDADLLLSLQAEVGTALSERLQEALGAEYFCSPTYEPGGECGRPTFVIQRIDLPDEVLAAFERSRTAAIDVEAREAEAEAIERLAAALAEAGDDYVLLKAIESGQVTFWVLPDGQVSLSPEGPSGAAPEEPTSDGEG